MTDEAGQYLPIGRCFAGHETVRHSIGEYVRGEAHTNTIEGYFSIFKRGMKGVYQHCASCSAPGSLDTSLSHAAGLIEIAACHA